MEVHQASQKPELPCQYIIINFEVPTATWSPDETAFRKYLALASWWICKNGIGRWDLMLGGIWFDQWKVGVS